MHRRDRRARSTKYGVVGQSGEKCLQGFPLLPIMEVSAEIPDEDFCSKPQIKRHRNKGTGASTVICERA